MKNNKTVLAGFLLYFMSFSLNAADLDAAIKYETQGRWGQALETVRNFLESNPEHYEANLAKGRLSVKTGAFDEALSVLLPLLAQNNKDWRPWFWTATAQMQMEDWASAAFHLDETLSREGKQSSIWVQRAIVAQEMEQTESALNLLQVALSLDSKNPSVWLNLAYAQEHSGNVSVAKQNYRQFLLISAKDSSYGGARAAVLRHLSMMSPG